MLDDRVRAVLARLEEEDAREREEGVPREQRARQVARTTGQFLFSLVAPQADCEVLEIGGSRGYSTIWLAAGVRYLGGHVLSLEHDPAKVDAWQCNIADAGLEDWADGPANREQVTRAAALCERARPTPRWRASPCRSTAASSSRSCFARPPERRLECAQPRKGGGPRVKSSSTGSGGTSG